MASPNDKAPGTGETPEVIVVHDSHPAAPADDRRAVPADQDMPVKMPADAGTAAEDVQRIGEEGKPADATSGPGMLRLEMIGLVIFFAAASIALGWWLGWLAGVLAFLWLILAIAANPVFWAMFGRIQTRREAVRQEREQRGS